jgi:hypothetical protein
LLPAGTAQFLKDLVSRPRLACPLNAGWIDACGDKGLAPTAEAPAGGVI